MAQHHTRTLGEAISGWWHNWKQGHANLSPAPRDAGVNSGKPRTLAGKWPDSADLLSQRLAALQLTENAVRQTEPQRPNHPDSK